jgi:hypothetical protein
MQCQSSSLCCLFNLCIILSPAHAPVPNFLQDPVPRVESLMYLQSVRSVPSAPSPGTMVQDAMPIVGFLLSAASACSMQSVPAPAPGLSFFQDPVPTVESLLSVQPVCSMNSAPAPGPVLQPRHQSTAILLPIAEPSLGTCILQPSSRSILAESSQTGAANSAARASADAVEARIRARWWQSLVPNGLAASIARERDVVWRLPRDEPKSLAEWHQHCEQEVRSISRSCVFYIGITDNPAHR